MPCLLFHVAGIIFLKMLTLPQTVFAKFEQQSPASKFTDISWPVPPRYGPRSVSPQTYDYHQYATFPTTTERWIDVDLNEQRIVLYKGEKAVQTFIVSTGLPGTQTVQGQFRIRMKVHI